MRKDKQSFVVHWLKPEQGSSTVEGRWKPWMVAGSTARRGKPLTGVWWDDVESSAVVVSLASSQQSAIDCLLISAWTWAGRPLCSALRRQC